MSETEQKTVLEHLKEISKTIELKGFLGNGLTPWLLYGFSAEEKSIAYGMLELYYWDDSLIENREVKELLRVGIELDKLIPDTYRYECNIEIL